MCVHTLSSEYMNGALHKPVTPYSPRVSLSHTQPLSHSLTFRCFTTEMHISTALPPGAALWRPSLLWVYFRWWPVYSNRSSLYYLG